MDFCFQSYFELAFRCVRSSLLEVVKCISCWSEVIANSAFVLAMHRWVFACYLLIYASYWCVIQDLSCLIQVSVDKLQECIAKKNVFAENLLHKVAHASFLQQTALIFAFVVIPVFVFGTLCMYAFPRRRVRMADGVSKTTREAHKNAKPDHTNSTNQANQASHKSASLHSPVKEPQRSESLQRMIASPPRSPIKQSPKQKHSPIRTLRTLNIFQPRSGNEVKLAAEPVDEKEALTPTMDTFPGPGEHTMPSQTASLADDERTVDNSSEMYTDYGTEAGASKTCDDQDFPYVLRKSVTNPRVLVGWRISLPTLGTGGTEGVIMSTVKRPFGATKFLVELQDGSLKQLALKRNARKGDVPFTLLEKTTYDL